jgi:YD repeat-containing protein
MKKSFRFCYFTLITCIFFETVYCQSSNNFQLPAFNFNRTPPSPEVASLGKYTEQPVSLSTGIPEISVPIYTIRVNDFELPISLSYHAGGVRVEEIASTCGLGWNLNAGGSVSRTIRGNRDEYPGNGYLDNNHTYTSVRDFFVANSTPWINLQLETFIDAVNNGNIDLEPDVFRYTMPAASSGVFFIAKEDKKVYSQLYNNYRFGYDRSSFSSFTQGITQWKITDSKGIMYLFGKNINSTNAYIENVNTKSISGGVRGGSSTHYSAWFLTEIILPNNADTIRFEYTANTNKYTNKIGETMFTPYMYANSISDRFVYSETTAQTYVIQSINGRFGKVLFNYATSDRLDLYGSKALSEVLVYTPDNELVQKTVLKTSYFVSDAPTSETGNIWYDPKSVYRLKLDEVELHGKNQTINKYKFGYDYDAALERKLPYRLSNSQDYWGYYNGHENTVLTPRYPDRTPNYITIGTLNKITYPTGGYTLFEYEPNQASTEDFDHEMGIPGEGEIEEETKAYINSNSILATGFNQNFIEIPFTIDNGSFRREVNFLKLVLDNPNACDFEPRYNGCFTKAELIKPSGEIELLPNRGERYVWCVSGVYKIRLTVLNKSQPNAHDASIQVVGPKNQVKLYNKTIGGLRIKKISQFDKIASQLVKAKNFYYTDPGNNSVSSGFLSYNGQFDYVFSYNTYNPSQPNDMITEKSFTRTSGSTYPLMMQGGSPVIYSNVSIIEEGAEQKLKTTCQFSVYGDNYQPALSYPLGPVINRGNLRNQLLSKKEYLFSNGTYSVLKETNHEYQYVSNGVLNSKYLDGIKMAPLGTGNEDALINDINDIKTYTEITDWVYLKKITEKDYNANQSAVVIQDFKYDNPSHGLVTEVSKADSKQNSIRMLISVPQDYNLPATGFNPQALAIKKLRENNIHVPVETVSVLRKPDGSEFITGGSLVVYDETILKPVKYYKLNISTPLLVNAFIKSFIDASGNFQFDNRYQLEVDQIVYDNRNNILAYKNRAEERNVLLWGLNALYPVAKAINASSNEIFFDSYEETGRWDANLTAIDKNFKRTGLSSGRIDKPTAGEQTSHSTQWLNISLTAPKKYKYSGWVYSDGPSAEIFLFMKRAGETGYFTYVDALGTAQTNKWVYIEKEYTVPADITQLNIRVDNNGGGTVWFDDIRLHPSDALMSTYTYQPLVGITSETDPNNRTTYYEYDAFNRLSVVRDKDNNILKKICYNYAGQPENCLTCYNYAPDWQNTATAIRCNKNTSNQNTGYQEQEQRDMNPCSPTYNSLRWTIVGYNIAACPLPPNCVQGVNCNGNNRKCINDACEIGILVIESYVNLGGVCYRYYHYEFSDGSWSGQFSEQVDPFSCHEQ